MKWIYSIITVLAIGFSLSVDNRVHPNQEISIQFQSEETSQTTIENTLSRLTIQLQNLGASHVVVTEVADGKFQIAYFSSLSTVQIQNSLNARASTEHELFNVDLETTPKFPTPLSEDDYQFSVSLIQSVSKNTSGFEGVLVENQQGAAATFHANAHPALAFESSICAAIFSKAPNRSFSHQNLALSILQYQIPEVRAGPTG